ncbi:MAG: hypothetical protein EOM90_14250 [Alphaproteobacteria bacterium]|nr:hypothetical protein [Alphaproteobacteria bacterium]
MKPSPTILLILIIASSCSPSQRLSRLLSYHPELKIPDTLMISDTITIPRVETDTLIHLDSIRDTIILQKERIEITISRIHDTLYIRGKCKADTIIVNRLVPVEKIKVVKQDKIDNLITKIPWIISGLIGILVFAMVIALKFFR